jgi:hypothetical protein
VQIYQLQPYNHLSNLYLSSIVCPATIYLQPRNSSLDRREPYFLRAYTIKIDRESIFKSTALLKVEAVSTNPLSYLPLNYTIINNMNNLFVIDSLQGYIYPRYDLGLSVNTYLIQVRFIQINFISTAKKKESVFFYYFRCLDDKGQSDRSVR